MTIETESVPIIVGIGEVLWDQLPNGKQFGGAPANFACHCSQMGAHGVLVSAVGQDELGLQARKDLLKRGVNTSYLSFSDTHPTGVVDVKVDAQGLPEYEIAANAAWDFIPWSDSLKELAESCNAVCFGTLGQRSDESFCTIGKFLKATGESCLRVLDINLRQSFYSRTLIEDSLGHANVLKLNEEELETICAFYGAEKSSPTDGLKQIQERFDLDTVVLTLGPKGSVITRGDETSIVEAYPMVAVDTVGAGDAFTAATVMGLLKGLPLDNINRTASRLAAHVCQFEGANPTIPDSLLEGIV